MRQIRTIAGLLALTLSAACHGAPSEAGMASSENSDQAQVLFEDSMAENWRENWFLDGQRATLEHRDGGLAFITEYTVNKRVDRAGFDAQHAVLWTRQEFEGNIRISYKYTKLPECGWQKLIYVQAQGIGEEPYVEDIHAWREHREVAVMSEYFKYMNLVSLSLRNTVRCKRYPVMDLEGQRMPSEFKPRAKNKGLEIGHELQVVIEKSKESIRLRIKDVETGQYAVDHSWDLSDKEIVENREVQFVDKGRIGLRLMGGHKINFRDFKVERL